jgi:hypothetical protein
MVGLGLGVYAHELVNGQGIVKKSGDADVLKLLLVQYHY